MTAGAAGVAAPQAGNTVNITAAASPGVYRQGAFYTIPIGGTVTRILYEPEGPEPILLNNPNAAIGYTIYGQVMNLDGTKGVLDMWLGNSRLLNDTLNMTGTVVINSYLDSFVSGIINLGSATAPAHLQTEVILTDTLNVGPSDHYAATTFDANVTVNAGSESTASTAATSSSCLARATSGQPPIRSCAGREPG